MLEKGELQPLLPAMPTFLNFFFLWLELVSPVPVCTSFTCYQSSFSSVSQSVDFYQLSLYLSVCAFYVCCLNNCCLIITTAKLGA